MHTSSCRKPAEAAGMCVRRQTDINIYDIIVLRDSLFFSCVLAGILQTNGVLLELTVLRRFIRNSSHNTEELIMVVFSTLRLHYSHSSTHAALEQPADPHRTSCVRPSHARRKASYLVLSLDKRGWQRNAAPSLHFLPPVAYSTINRKLTFHHPTLSAYNKQSRCRHSVLREVNFKNVNSK